MPDQSTALVPAEEPKAIVVIRNALEERIDDIAAVLPEGMRPERFVRTAILAVSKNPDIMACSQASIVRSIVEAAELGLEPTGSLSRAWLVPFKDKDKQKPDAQLIIGYQGLADLMRDTGRIRQVWAEVVYEGDAFEYQLGAQPRLEHVPNPDAPGFNDPTKAKYVYACARFADGEVQFHVMTRMQVEAIRAKARSRNSPAWTGSWPAMARKTALRQLANYVPLSTKAQGAIEAQDEREFGEPIPQKEQPKSSTLRDVLRAQHEKLAQPAVDGPGRDENAEQGVSVSGESAAQQTGSQEPTEAATQVVEVCGETAEALGCGPCVLEPDHKAREHKDARDQEWTSPKGGKR